LKENVPRAKFRRINVNIQGINGGDMHIKEGMLQINDSGEILFYNVESLPRSLDLILGQQWLLRNDYFMTCPNTILLYPVLGYNKNWCQVWGTCEGYAATGFKRLWSSEGYAATGS
jgi:hypothetical protein